MRQYRREMEKGRDRLHEELISELYSYIETLKIRMEEQFKKFDDLLAVETTELQSLQQESLSISNELEQIKKMVTKAF
jgi:hypothetical protein